MDTINVLDHGFVRYIDHLGSDTRIVESARVSYKLPSKGADKDKNLLEYLYKNKHTSPFEMAKITFNIKMPIFVMRQFVRHRMQNINEVSARYTQLPKEFYIPEKWRLQDKKNKQGSVDGEGWRPEIFGCDATKYVTSFCEQSYRNYEALLSAGVTREMARMVLPINIYTEIYSTWDLNNLLKFFMLRDDNHAQWEHQQFARAMKEITKKYFPWTIEIYEKYRQKS